MEVLFDKLFSIFSLEYMFAVIIASYFAIKFIDSLNGDLPVPTWAKRVVTFIFGILFFVIFNRYTETHVQTLICSYFAAVFIYDTAIKYLIRKFDIDYKK